MEKNEIQKRIIKALSTKFKHGAFTKELRDSIGIYKKNFHDSRKFNTCEREFYTALKSLRKQKKIAHISYGRKEINYLPKYEKAVMLNWGINEQDINLQRELTNIHSGYVFIERKVLEEGKGIISPYQKLDNEYYQEFLPYSLLPIVPNIPDIQDTLVFLIENLNDYPVKEVGASIFIDKYEPGDSISYENCKVKKESHMFYITCDELFPNQTAYVVIPLRELDIKFDGDYWEQTDRPCRVQGWYGTTPLLIREGRLLIKEGNTSPTTLIEWDIQEFRRSKKIEK